MSGTSRIRVRACCPWVTKRSRSHQLLRRPKKRSPPAVAKATVGANCPKTSRVKRCCWTCPKTSGNVHLVARRCKRSAKTAASGSICYRPGCGPRYSCADQVCHCTCRQGGVKQTPPPPSPVPGGRFDFSFVAQVVTSKIADHLPLYRQQDIFGSQRDAELSRSTLCQIMASAGELGWPLANFMTKGGSWRSTY